MEFLWPLNILALLLPFLARYFTKPLSQKNGQAALCVPFFKVFQNQSKTTIYSRSNIVVFLFILGFICLVISSMRPIVYKDAISLPVNGRQTMLVLDLSESMSIPDFVWNGKRTSRIGAVQNIAFDFIENRTGDAVGLTIFGNEAYLYTPLTLDTKTAAQMLKETGAGMAGPYTAIGDGLLVALKQMKDIPADKKVIILLSDGYANAGKIHPLDAAQMAKQMDVKIHTIGIGSAGEWDEALLQKIAQDTNGIYFPVKNTSDLKKVYDELDKIEPTQMDGKTIRPQTELFWIPLCCAMGLFFIGLYLKRKSE